MTIITGSNCTACTKSSYQLERESTFVLAIKKKEEKQSETMEKNKEFIFITFASTSMKGLFSIFSPLTKCYFISIRINLYHDYYF